MINNFEKSARSNEIYRNVMKYNVMATNNKIERRIKIPVLKRAKKCSIFVRYTSKQGAQKVSMNRVQKKQSEEIKLNPRNIE